MVSSIAFIIFGTKLRDKEHGPTYPIHCPHCRNDVMYHALEWRTWGHIFWIPIIPWSKHYELVCPICGASIELDRNEFKYAKWLSESVSELDEANESPEARREYRNRLEKFEDAVSFVDIDSKDAENRDYMNISEDYTDEESEPSPN